MNAWLSGRLTELWVATQPEASKADSGSVSMRAIAAIACLMFLGSSRVALAGEFYPLGASEAGMNFLDLNTIRGPERKTQAWTNLVYYRPQDSDRFEADFELALLVYDCSAMTFHVKTVISYALAGGTHDLAANPRESDIPPGSAVENAEKIVCSSEPRPKGFSATNEMLVRAVRAKESAMRKLH